MVKTRREGFPRQHRIVRGSDYRSIYGTGRKLNSGRFVLFARENNLDHQRLGITVSRKVGGAVIRNRVKRLFREIFRKSSADLPDHFDLVVNAKRACAEASYGDLRDEFIIAVRRICG
ncbi:MAG TPA: ribonuclease P protein component [Acidobacteriota bacterium]|nr:ribonuclease P protein component [Acidobacteriota bacterium]